MPNSDAFQMREKILSILRIRGPLLPVHIANETGLSMLFSSAFLSELLSEKEIKISFMKVGNSPIYFIPGHEPNLEKYSSHLKSREKDAFILLKEKGFLKDSEQEPAIRVALRSIRDFAIPFKRNEEICWRYFTIPESEFKSEIKPIEEHRYIEAKQKAFDSEERQISEKIIKDIKVEDIKTKEEKHPVLNIFEKAEIKKIAKKKIIKSKNIQKKTSKKKNENFFNKVKDILTKKQIEILDIENFNKNDLILRIKENQEEKLLFAYNKKKISELDLIKANKKSSELNLRYSILSLGEPSKKTTNFIEAIKNLSEINKINEN